MFQKFYRQIFDNVFSRIRRGVIEVRHGERRFMFGSTDVAAASQDDLDLYCRIDIHDDAVFRKMATDGSVGAAESYMVGHWSCTDLTALLRIFTRNLDLADGLNQGIGLIRQIVERTSHMLRRNTVAQAKKNIHQHYDLGNDFFALMLDPTMNYSSGIFQKENDTMFQASLNKMWRICKKLDLQPEDHLLEIGTGWGGLAMFAAKFFGCKVTTTTISEEQFLLARRRVKKAGLQRRVNVIQKDYRALEGKFDKIVSIEMIEAVGHEYLGEFFRKCQSLVVPSGLMLLQSIVIRDNRFRSHVRNVDFIRKYIFPGGCLPSNSILLNSIQANANLQLLNLEDIGIHYAKTLQDWRETFEANLDNIRTAGFDDERFLNMWRYYLCYCEAGFLERQVNNVQMLLGGERFVQDVSPGDWELNGQELETLGDRWYQMEPNSHNVQVAYSSSNSEDRFIDQEKVQYQPSLALKKFSPHLKADTDSTESSNDNSFALPREG